MGNISWGKFTLRSKFFFSSTSFLCLQLLSICYCYSFITKNCFLQLFFNLRIWLKCPNCNFHPFCDVKWVVMQHVSRALSKTPRTVTVEKRWAISPEKNWRRRGKTILALLKPTLIFHHEKQFKNIILFLKHTPKSVYLKNLTNNSLFPCICALNLGFTSFRRSDYSKQNN